jgi:two-component system KDP operon response regulator KdpE
MPHSDGTGRTALLLIEPAPYTHRRLRQALEAAGYLIDQVHTAEAALPRIATRPPAIIMLDAACASDREAPLSGLRAATAAPIVVLSAGADEAARIRALDAGANDYVTPAISPGELLARLRACLRRATEASGRQIWSCGEGLTVDLAQRSVTRAGVKVPLSPTEFDLLALLVRNAGRLMTHRQLLMEVWGPAHRHDIQYLRVYIGHLRQKLGAGFATCLRTEPGVGYRLEQEG